MDAHSRESDSEESRLKRLYDRLAGLLKGLSPSRRHAFEDWIDEQAKDETEDAADQLRQAMTDSGKTQYRIAKDTGISQPLITRFVNGDRGISLETADKLMDYLGLELRPKDDR